MDQRTFERAPTGPQAAQLQRPDLPPLPTLTIPFAPEQADWRSALRDAVQAVQAHRPGAAFSVVTPIPTSASREVQDRFIKQGQDDAILVSRELQVNGIPPDRIALAERGDPGNPRREVRLYVQ